MKKTILITLLFVLSNLLKLLDFFNCIPSANLKIHLFNQRKCTDPLLYTKHYARQILKELTV